MVTEDHRLLRQEFSFRILEGALHTSSRHSQFMIPTSPLAHKLPEGSQGPVPFLCQPGIRAPGGQHSADHCKDSVSVSAALQPIPKQLILKSSYPSVFI